MTVPMQLQAAGVLLLCMAWLGLLHGGGGLAARCSHSTGQVADDSAGILATISNPGILHVLTLASPSCQFVDQLQRRSSNVPVTSVSGGRSRLRPIPVFIWTGGKTVQYEQTWGKQRADKISCRFSSAQPDTFSHNRIQPALTPLYDTRKLGIYNTKQ